MTLLQLVVLLIIAGVILAIVNSVIPMQPNIKKILNLVIVVALGLIAIVWLLAWVGLDLNAGPRIR